MDQLTKLVSEKAGITPEQAQKAVQHVVEFFKEKLPAGLGGHLEGLLNNTGGEPGTGGGFGDIASKIGGMLGGK